MAVRVNYNNVFAFRTFAPLFCVLVEGKLVDKARLS